MNAELWGEPLLSRSEISHVRTVLGGVPATIADPSEWTPA